MVAGTAALGTSSRGLGQICVEVGRSAPGSPALGLQAQKPELLLDQEPRGPDSLQLVEAGRGGAARS